MRAAACIGANNSFRLRDRSHPRNSSSLNVRTERDHRKAAVTAAATLTIGDGDCESGNPKCGSTNINSNSNSNNNRSKLKHQSSESGRPPHRLNGGAPTPTQPSQTMTTATKTTRNRRQNSTHRDKSKVSSDSERSSRRQNDRHRRNDHSDEERQRHHRRYSIASSTSGSSSSCSGSCSSSDDGETNSTSSGEPNLAYPGFPDVALKYLTQDTRPRNWCLMLITNPWFERISILVIILNCITLGMYQPCVDDACVTNRCKILQMFDDIIFAFFALEMSIKMVAMGMYGKNTYLADSWNRLDFFIVLAGLLEYVMHVENLNLTAIRTIRVLRPLRAINRIPSMRILVMLLLDTLPMLGNVLLLCFFVFFIFGIIGVQLWEGILRQRCVLQLPPNVIAPKGLPEEFRVRVRVNSKNHRMIMTSVSFYYEFSKEQDFICSKPEDSGMHLCSDLPPYRVGPMLCNASAVQFSYNRPTNRSCVNWNQYYTNCTQLGGNPFQGTISFDNIGLAWVAIFLVISLEGWTDIMYYVQDAHSFWDWIYFVLLIVIGSFFMINLCLVVIATQFSETKKREMERMRQERARYTSTSTLASSTNNSEPATCYAEIVKYIAHLWRRFKRRLLKKYRLYKYQRQQRKEGLLPNSDNLTFSPSRIKGHHPKCPNYGRKPSNIQDQMITVMVPLNSNNNIGGGSNSNSSYSTTGNMNHNHNQHHQLQQQQQQQQQQQNRTNHSPLNSQHPINNNSSSENSELSIETTGRHPSNLKKNKDQQENHHNYSNHHHHNHQQQKTILLKIPTGIDSEQLINHPCTSGFLSPPTSARRRSSVMFNDYVILHTPPPPSIPEPTKPANTMTTEKNVCSSEKMTQTNDGSIWQVNLPQTIGTIANHPYTDCSELGLHDAMTCQELLAFSVAFSAALPTGQSTLESFYTSLARFDPHSAEAIKNQQNLENTAAAERGSNATQTVAATTTAAAAAVTASSTKKNPADGGLVGVRNNNNISNNSKSGTSNYIEDYSCCYDLYQNALSPLDGDARMKKKKQSSSKFLKSIIFSYHTVSRSCSFVRRHIQLLVEHKYFQQGILLAILINTLSMGIEYHNQPEELTAIVETSNIAFSAIFAVEMLLKVVAEGPFGYIANGFNVFDGVIVILSAIEICQTFTGNGTGGGGSSGLSVLRTFRLLRILKLVRFMPNLRRQLFVMLRTMDNVAIFFSLLVLFIFIFSILGMYLFGGKFCKFMDDSGQERECTCPEIISKHPQCECDRKHFNNILWATVTVFQILTQEDWNVVLFNGMEKTSHWAALYFVALMTFGNYVLFNLLVAILVEGFSSERNERREREQRELVKKLREETLAENFSDILYDESRSTSESSSTNESYYEIRNKWHSAEELRKDSNEVIIDPKCNIQRQRLLQPILDYQLNESTTPISNRKTPAKDVSRLLEDDKKILKKTYSIKERRSEGAKLAKLRPLREPPIITTTAATPQDSPNTTLESGASFKNWNQNELFGLGLKTGECVLKSHSSPALLKPPTIFNGQRTLDEGIPSIDLIPPSPVLSHKPINILNASNLGSNLSIHSNLSSSNSLISDIENSAKLNATNDAPPPIAVQTISSAVSPPQQSATTATTTLPQQQQQQQQLMTRSSSFKRFRRSSSKKKKNDTTATTTQQVEGEQNGEKIILNNGRENSNILNSNSNCNSPRNDPFLLAGGSARIQNNTKDTNRLSPQNSIRRMSTSIGSTPIGGGGSGGGSGSSNGSRRASSCIYNNSQFYQNLSRHNSMKNYIGSASGNVGVGVGVGCSGSGQRRMSSIEIAFGKASNLNLYNFDANRKSLSYTNSKIDLDKWQKSLSNMNEPEMLQQQEIKMKRKNSLSQQQEPERQQQQQQHSLMSNSEGISKIKILIERFKPTNFTEERDSYSMYIFPEENRFRQICTWFVNQKWFDNVVLLFIALNCITLAMERPNIPPYSPERLFLATANYVFTVVFTLEMLVKVVATGMFYGDDAYFTSGWNIMDGSLVTISIIDLLMSLISESSPRIFGILRVFRLLRSLRPLRVINRAPGLKLVVQTLLSSLRPIGNIVLICCTFFIIFGILGVQLFKGTFYYCEGENIKNVRNKTDCLAIEGNAWINRKYNFDDLGKALMSLFVLSSRDGWVNIMYTGLDAVGVDQQPIVNFNEWRLLYFIAFILLVGFFVLNMFVGVVVENFHRCREEQEKEEKIRRAAKRALQMEKKRRRMHEPPYYTNYSATRMFVHNVVTSKYFDLAIAAVIGLNVVTMAMEYYMMPIALEYALKIFNYFFTAVFILEATMKLVALGWRLYLKDKWNQLDVGIVILSIVGIVLEELETKIIPINPTIIRVMRVLRIARVLKLLKMAKGIRALLDTVMQALPQVGNLGLLFFLLFFIFAALGVELFGRLECSDEIPCQGLGEHAHFANFGMAFLTLFRVATGDNWNGIMKDTLRDNCDDAADCVRNCCVSSIIAPIFFVIFVLMAQFVLVNVVVAVLMKHLEESHKQMEDEMDMDVELERELVREQEFEQEQALCLQLQQQEQHHHQQNKQSAATVSTCNEYSATNNDENKQNQRRRRRPLEKVLSLPSNFTYSTPSIDKKFFNSTTATGLSVVAAMHQRRQTMQQQQAAFSAAVNLTEFGAGGGANTKNMKKMRKIDGVASAAITEESENSFAMMSEMMENLQVPLAQIQTRRGRRASAFRKRMLLKERSLDEQAIRRRNLESKQMSCDNLPRSDDGTIFESLESENGATTDDITDARSTYSDQGGRIGSHHDTISLIADKSSPLSSIGATTTTTTATTVMPSGSKSKEIIVTSTRKLYGPSVSTDPSLLGPSRNSLLSVPRSMPPRSRSGSTKQLFKQQALDEDPDMDESSLLLPSTKQASSLDKNATTAANDSKNGKSGNASGGGSIEIVEGAGGKPDSTEILRIISERRRMDKSDTNSNDDSDYKELLLVKSAQSSMEA